MCIRDRYNTDYGNDYSLYFAGFIGSNNKLISCYIEMSNLYAFTGYGMPADFNNQYINCQLDVYKRQ